jgi:non-ribosomal peptide synthase protein (TIGR01720 family)
VASDEIGFVALDLSCSDRVGSFERELARVQAAMDLEHGPLLWAIHVRGLGESERLVLTAHHLVVDIVSWQILIEDLDRACTQLRQGQAVTLPPKTASYRQWGEAQLHYAQSEVLRQRAPAWQAVAAQASPTDASGWGVEASTRRSSASLDERVTLALIRDAPGKLEVSTENLLVSLLARIVAEQLGRRRLIVEFEGHNRDELPSHPGGVPLDLTRTVGWFTSLFPVVLELDLALDPIELVRAVERQRAAAPSRGGDHATLRWLADPELASGLRMPIPELGFNYGGRVARTRPDALFEIVDAPELARAGACPRMHRWDVDCIVDSGRLRLWWSYSDELDRAELVDAMMQRLCAALEGFAELLEQRGDADFPELQLDADDMSRLLDELGLGAGDDA